MRKKLIKLFSLILVLVLSLSLFACGGSNDNDKDKDKEKENNDTPTINYDITDLSVRDYRSENGVVAAANPYAAYAGLQMLMNGGNAFDAACAIAFALGVCEPNASGIGGGGIMVAYDARTGEKVSYNFREFVPAAGTAETYQRIEAALGVTDKLKYGSYCPGVPTEVAGLLKIIEERGTLTRQTILAPAIKYASEGVKVTPELAKQISDNSAVIMMSKKEVRDVFTSDGFEYLQTGELLVQEDYGKVLQEISDKGLDGFYKGWVADAIIEACGAANGGIMTQEDLDYAAANYPKNATPLEGTYRGYDIITANTPSSGGIILVEALNMLECYGDISKLEHNSAEYINVVSTALQLAYGDKRQFIADQEYYDVPIKGLMSKLYAAERWQKFVEGKAYLGRFQGDSDYGDPWSYEPKNTPLSCEENDGDEHYSTTSFSVADKEGNIVSVTQTINHFFGSGVVPHGCGFFMNDQLTSFSYNNTAAFIQPYKQPVSHIMPTIIMKDGDPFATLGSPGSMRIPSAVTETVINMIDFGMDIQTAINTPRFYSYACANADYGAGENKKDLYVEGAIYATEERAKLEAMGYYVLTEGKKDIDLFFGGVQGIQFEYKDGKTVLHGGADPRRDGKALGW